MDKPNVIITTDGACSGNPGPGGWAAILRIGEYSKEIHGNKDRTTNNRMEFMAAIKAIEALKKPCVVTIRTDSQTLCNAIENLDYRAKTGWKTKTGATCANVDLLQRLHKAKTDGNHEIFYKYVQGHAGDPDNERCDTLAKEEAQIAKASLEKEVA